MLSPIETNAPQAAKDAALRGVLYACEKSGAGLGGRDDREAARFERSDIVR